MQATAPFNNIRINLISKESLRALVTVKVADLLYLTGIRVIDGKKGLFVSMPSKKETSGDYKDIFFPASRDIRDQLQAAILEAYHGALAKAGVTRAPEEQMALAAA
jgi:stage V sporulation protein G